jgi:hypothetical protein
MATTRARKPSAQKSAAEPEESATEAPADAVEIPSAEPEKPRAGRHAKPDPDPNDALVGRKMPAGWPDGECGMDNGHTYRVDGGYIVERIS